MVKEASSFEMPEDRKKLGYEVYPHMVEQLVGKIKEQQETAPWAREDFDELISCLKKLAKVGQFTSHVRWCPSTETQRLFLGDIRGTRRI